MHGRNLWLPPRRGSGLLKSVLCPGLSCFHSRMHRGLQGWASLCPPRGDGVGGRQRKEKGEREEEQGRGREGGSLSFLEGSHREGCLH